MQAPPRMTVEVPLLSLGEGPADYEALGSYVDALRRPRGLHMTLLHVGILEDFAGDVAAWTKGFTSAEKALERTASWLRGLPVLDGFTASSQRLLSLGGGGCPAWKSTFRRRCGTSSFPWWWPFTACSMNLQWTTSTTSSSARRPWATGPRTGHPTLQWAGQRPGEAGPSTSNRWRWSSGHRRSGMRGCWMELGEPHRHRRCSLRDRPSLLVPISLNSKEPAPGGR